MISSISQRIEEFLVVTFLTFLVYLFSFSLGKYGVHLLGFIQEDLYSIVLTIVLTSIISFLLTLLIHYFYQKNKFLNEMRFIRNYHGVHHIYLYISGLLGVISLLEPLLLEEKIIDVEFNSMLLSFAGIIFFVILSNYSFYNSFVINNEFLCFETLEGVTRIRGKNIIAIFSIVIGIVLLFRFIVFKDELSLTLIILLNLPWYIYKFFIQVSN